MGVVGRLDQYASMLAYEFDETTANNASITGLGTYYATEFNENIVDIVRDGLVLNLDAGNLASYPGSGTTWTDLSGNNNTGTLTNGPTYSSANGGSIVFDGTNDYIQINQTLTTPFTITGFIKYTDQAKTLNTYMNTTPHTVLGISLNRTGIGDLYVYIGNGSGWLAAPSIISSTNMLVNTWYQVTFTSTGSGSILYLNGVNVGTSVYSPSGWGSPYYLGTGAGEYLRGNIATTSIYNRALTAAEISQNFNALATRFGLATTNSTAPMLANIFPPYDLVYDEFSGTSFGAGQGRYMRQNTDKSVIVYNEIDEVTDLFGRGIVRYGLVLDLDAGNTASYSGSGTTWTDLSASGNTGTLTNGPNYSSANGGSLVFDGVDDYVLTSTINHNIGTGNFTYSAWVYPTSLKIGGASLCAFMGNGDYAPTFGFDLNGYPSQLGFYWSGWNGFGTTLSLNQWYCVTMTRVGTLITGYLNANACPVTYNVGFSMSNAQYVIGRSGVNYAPDTFKGNIPQVSIYNRALTAAEISQNYNALKGRYGL